MKVKAQSLVKGDVVEVENPHDKETYRMEVESSPSMDRTGCSILLIDDDLRVFKYSCLRDSEVELIRESYLRAAASPEEEDATDG